MGTSPSRLAASTARSAASCISPKLVRQNALAVSSIMIATASREP